MDEPTFDIKLDIPEPQAVSKKLMVFNGLLLVSIIGMIFVIHNDVLSPKPASQIRVVSEVNTHAFDNVLLAAKSAYVLDVAENKVIYQKHADKQLPLASLTKLMTALTATELLPQNSKITIKKEFLEEDGDQGLALGESWSLKDLLDFSLVASSNDGARSIASVVGAFNLKSEDLTLGRKDFIVQMNKKAGQLGLKQTYFINETGLDVAGTTSSGGYGSAADMGTLMKYIVEHKPGLLEATKYPTTVVGSNIKSHKVKNTNTDVGVIPGLIASKTGYTELAGGNLAIAFDASIERPIIIVVLGSTEAGRFTDVQTLVKATQSYITQ